MTNRIRRSGWPPRRAFVAVALAILFVSAGRQTASAAQELVVFQAASLKDVFAKLARRFELDNPGIKVVANAAGSHELRTQIEHGAAADVMASADRKHMDALLSQGLVVTPTVFACNELVIVVRAALAASIRTLADLPRAERIVIGEPDVPIGAYTLQVLQRAAARYGANFPGRVDAKVVSRELNVRQVLAKVVLGEADAGVVYRSDAITARGKVEIVAIPADLNVVAEYPIAALKTARRPDFARRWIDLVKSPEGAGALRDAGFSACPSR